MSAQELLFKISFITSLKVKRNLPSLDGAVQHASKQRNNNAIQL
jgi:hypothetical protein